MDMTVEGGHEAARPDGPAQRVVVWAPVGRTAEVVQEVVVQAGFEGVACDDVESFCRLVDEGAGAAVLVEEVFGRSGVAERVQNKLEVQPSWSDLPVYVFVHNCKRVLPCFDYLTQTSSRRGVTILERPISPETLTSLLAGALRNRRRQYQLRDAIQQLQDVNDRLEEQVEVRTNDVRSLASELTRSEQRERRRIARVLHDGLQQQLYAAQMQLQVAETDVPEAAEALGRVHVILDEGIQMARHLAAELSPPMLHTEGLEAALVWLAGRAEARFGLRVALEGDTGADPPDADLRELMYQSVRELLFNVVKHADVDAAEVRLSQQDGWCLVEVRDEGRGFDPSALPTDGQRAGLGLANVMRRIRVIGGTADVHTAPEQGTQVRLRFPVDGSWQ